MEALQNDQIHALVLQNPFKMGYLGVKTLAAHLAHQPVEKRIDTGVALVTKDNMNDPGYQLGIDAGFGQMASIGKR